MNIFHFIIGKANKNRSNGVNQVIAGLCKYSSLNGQSLRVIGLASNAVTEGEIVQRDGFQVEVYSKWSLKLFKALVYHLKWCDILHLHGVYNWSNIVVGKIAKWCLTPFVITAHNGFSPSMSKFRKKLFDVLIQKRFMESALAIHILAQEEGTEILEMCTPKSFIMHQMVLTWMIFLYGSAQNRMTIIEALQILWLLDIWVELARKKI